MSYVYGKIKNIKIEGKGIFFQFESDWKIVDYKNENKILNLYCVNENMYRFYDEKITYFEIDYNQNEKFIDFLINNIHECYKIEFEEKKEYGDDDKKIIITISSLEIINE